MEPDLTKIVRKLADARDADSLAIWENCVQDIVRAIRNELEDLTKQEVWDEGLKIKLEEYKEAERQKLELFYQQKIRKLAAKAEEKDNYWWEQGKIAGINEVCSSIGSGRAATKFLTEITPKLLEALRALDILYISDDCGYEMELEETSDPRYALREAVCSSRYADV